jgi:hypothetical protein
VNTASYRDVGRDLNVVTLPHRLKALMSTEEVTEFCSLSESGLIPPVLPPLVPGGNAMTTDVSTFWTTISMVWAPGAKRPVNVKVLCSSVGFCARTIAPHRLFPQSTLIA